MSLGTLCWKMSRKENQKNLAGMLSKGGEQGWAEKLTTFPWSQGRLLHFLRGFPFSSVNKRSNILGWMEKKQIALLECFLKGTEQSSAVAALQRAGLLYPAIRPPNTVLHLHLTWIPDKSGHLPFRAELSYYGSSLLSFPTEALDSLASQ